MFSLLLQVFRFPGVTLQILAIAFLANVLALAPTIYSMQVFSHYMGHGMDGTLVTLMIGFLVAIGTEFGFERIQKRLASGLSARIERELGEKVFKTLTTARTSA
ncbi:MAG: hypothetical protein HQL56_13110, partial [Magnetococcales bacterium]|nr:hypothetical protein [Magnetococcales bacterium]